MRNIASIALKFLGRGGKKLRPRLCKAVFDYAGGCGEIDVLCEAIECFHKASLIHDDIQDGDEERYGVPTVWCEYNVPIAIAAGDWLVAHGYQLVAHSNFANKTEMLTAIVDSHIRLCEGQGDDLLLSQSEMPYRRTCELKTGEAFALAAHLGALAAGVDPIPFHNWGIVFGVLFQIRDDLVDDVDDARISFLRELEKKVECELREITPPNFKPFGEL